MFFFQLQGPHQTSGKNLDDRIVCCIEWLEEQRGRVAWAVMWASQVVVSVSIMVKHAAEETKLRKCLMERLKEKQAVKDKVITNLSFLLIK